MAQQKVEVRRAEILSATIEQMHLRGMAMVRVGDVARSLGVSSGLVFYHFDSKDRLLVAALEAAVERDLARLDDARASAGGPVRRLASLLATYGPTGTAPGWTLWIDAWSTALREPTVGAALRRLDERWRAALASVVTDGVTTGAFECPDPAVTAARIGALLDGLSVAVLVYQSVTRAQLRAWVRAAAAAEVGIDPDALT
jgi:AcrR family transcriptional regulator